MSIYSGFATRQQEQNYDLLIDDLIYVMTKRIIKFYQNDPADEVKFAKIISNIYNQLFHMEKSKYLEPKTSQSLLQLQTYLKKQLSKNGSVKHTQGQLPVNNLLNPQQYQINNKDSLSLSLMKQQSSIGKIKHQFKIRNDKRINMTNLNDKNQNQQKQSETQSRPNTQGKARKSYSSHLPPNKDFTQVLKKLVTHRKNCLRKGKKLNINEDGPKTFGFRMAQNNNTEF